MGIPMPPNKTPAGVAMAPAHSHLIGLEPVLEIVHVSLLSGFIEKATPVAIMLVGPSGGGKTATLKRFSGEFIHQTNDLTASGLWQILRDDKDEKISHIMLEDFNPVLSHKSSVSSLTIASLLSVMADGMMRIDDGRERKELKHKPVGIVTGVTPEMFSANLEKWHGLGLVRRFLPIHFSYKQETIHLAQQQIKKGNVSPKPLPPLQLQTPKVKVSPIIPNELAADIEMQSVYLGTHLGVNSFVTKGKNNEWKREYTQGTPVLPMAPHMILRTMAQARALLHGRMKCDESDMSFLRSLVSFVNPLQPAQL